MGNFRIRVNEIKNHVYITVEGTLTVEEALILKEDYREAIAKCRPGFTVLTDAAKYAPGSPEVQKIHGEIVKMDAAAGVSKVARVVGETPLGGMQIIRIAGTENEYPSKNFRTLKEAVAYIDDETE